MIFKYIYFKCKPLLRIFGLFLMLYLGAWQLTALAEDSENQPEPNTEQQTGDTLPADGQDSPPTTNEGEENKTPENTETESTQPAVERARLTNKQKISKRHGEILKHLKLYKRENELLELTAKDEAFYGFFLQERTGQPQGAVLILHDIEQHGHWPKLVAPLREGLPDSGWITLSIELPYRPSVIPAYKIPTTQANANQQEDNTQEQADSEESEANAAEQNETEPEATEPEATEPEATAAADDESEQANIGTSDNEPELPKLDSLPAINTDNANKPDIVDEPEDLMQAYRDSVKARIDSALSYLRSRGQFNLVIIGSGEAAIWAADTTLNLDKKEGLALVMIDAKESPAANENLIEKIANIELPILDLITADNPDSKLQLKLRKGEMRHRNKSDYSQIRLPQKAGYADAFEPLEAANYPATRRIRGWLRSKAAGTALKVPRSQME